MNETLPFELYSNLVKYLSNSISLREFRDWFDAATWGVPGSGLPVVEQVAGEIELRIAEHTNGHLDEEELRSRLQPMILAFGLLLCRTMMTTRTTSVTAPWASFGSTFGKSGVEVFSSGLAPLA